MNKVSAILNSILSKTLAFLMFFMVLNVLWQVFSRYVLNSPSSFTDELARYLLIWLGVLSAAYVSGAKSHLAIDLLKEKFTGAKKIKLEKTLSFIIMLFALSALVVGGSRLVYITFILGQKTAALQIPLAYIYGIIPLSGIIIVLYKVADLLTTQPKTEFNEPD